jgi:hypothetical protein
MKMLNKDKRSIVMSLLLGDGCLHKSGSFSADHGLAQADYVSWKAQLLTEVFEREIRQRSGHQGKSTQVQAYDRRLRSWHKFIYRGGKKSISKILRFITHPEFAIALWLMDDGYVEPSFSKLADGTKKNYGARFRLFTCDQSLEEQSKIIDWFSEKFQVIPKVHYQHDKRTDKTYPFLKINGNDSLKLWGLIRDWVLVFKSMQYKFRFIEQMHQHKLSQCDSEKNPMI